MTFERINDRLTLIDQLPTMKRCQELSLMHRGTIHRGNYFVSHSSGSKLSRVWLMRTEWERIQQARAITTRIIEQEPTGYTYSHLAREITEWLDISQSRFSDASLLLPNWHYQKVIPFEGDGYYLHDMTAAYWQMIERVPSPKFSIIGRRIVWHQLLRGEENQWMKLLSMAKLHKRLRLAIVGVNSAGWNASSQNPIATQFHGTQSYCDGKCKPLPLFRGKLTNLSLLAVRCTYELCQIQSEHSHSIYSNADCCISQRSSMEYWDACKIAYTCKASGYARINSIGNYQLGLHSTKPYQQYPFPEFIEERAPRPIDPPFLHCQFISIV